MGAKAVELTLRLCLPHHLVHQLHDGGRVAPRVVAAQALTAEVIHHKLLRGHEDLRLGTAKAVDALLGVTDDEDAGRLCPATRARVAAEPGL